MKHTIYALSGGVIATAFLLSGAACPVSADTLSGEALVDALRAGGYTIYFRHAITDQSQADRVSKEGDWTSCDPGRMRQLSDAGREQARKIGEIVRSLSIPVGKVLTSEYCRAKETGELLGVAKVTPTRTLMNMYSAGFVGGREKAIERARAEIGTKPERGTNTVLVAHGNLMDASTGEYTVEGGAGVFLPKGNGKFTLVAMISPARWEELARLYR